MTHTASLAQVGAMPKTKDSKQISLVINAILPCTTISIPYKGSTITLVEYAVKVLEMPSRSAFTV